MGIQNESFEPFQPHHQPPYSYRTHPSTPTMTYTTDIDVSKSAAAVASPYPMLYNQDNTVFVSPHAEYNIPVVALHSCKYRSLTYIWYCYANAIMYW